MEESNYVKNIQYGKIVFDKNRKYTDPKIDPKDALAEFKYKLPKFIKYYGKHISLEDIKFIIKNYLETM